MWWAAPRPAGDPGTWTHENVAFHDLFDDDNHQLGYIWHDKRVGMFYLYENPNHRNTFDRSARFTPVTTLEEAKEQMAAHFVSQRLEE